ncbi:MAG: 1-deoxy-D-xylulose-5-phosphate synthase [Oscillospiraceae bacterium]|nr:1-deoxy-D-xylulose-5-phosphate synthase [Oscillospiraceae bacterium]
MKESILQKIKSPDDLKALPPEDLPRLAGEIRRELIRTLSKNGGHLASNLGVVELSMALHLCFDSPRDALVWDVSHQCYTHKLLTGRYEAFHTLRQSHGLCGFTNPAESEHDFFLTGHASASASAALGLAEGKRLLGDGHYTVAVLGDGALTGGLVYEALNNAGQRKPDAVGSTKLIVVLNDNGMSIAPNVGGLSSYLLLLRSKPGYRLAKLRVERFFKRIPLVGKPLARVISLGKRVIKKLFTSSTIFEKLGLDYLGPVDGHDLDQLREALTSAKMMPRPVLVHVRTVKGKGYGLAERAPDTFHGVSCFDVDSGAPLEHCGCFSAAFGTALAELARENAAVCAVTAAMALGTGLMEFQREFPARCFDVGIAESHAVTFAAGLARQGLRPVVPVYSTFLQRAYDQLHHDAALQRLPLTIAVDRAGFVGEDGATHHGLYDVAFCASIPCACVYAPVTEPELAMRLRRAVLEPREQVTFLRYPRDCAWDWPEELPPPTEAAFERYGDPGASVALVTYGRLCKTAYQVYQDRDIRLIKLNQLLPLDPEAALAVLGCERVCFFEEGTRCGGAGERFGALLLEQRFAGESRLTAVDGFPRHAPVEELMAEYGLDYEGMVRALDED